MEKSDIVAGIGLASSAASMIPGVGTAVGIIGGLGSQVLSWILGDQKIDWDAKRREALANNQRVHDTALTNAVGQANKSFDATIGQTTNTQSMAGSVAGISGAGTGRLQAQTYANVAENRDRSVSNITNALAQNLMSANMAVNRDYGQLDAQQEMNAPTTLDYAGNFLKSLQTPVMQEGIGAILGAGGAGLASLFKKGKTTPITNSRYSNYMQGGRRFNDDYGEGVVDLSQPYRSNTPLDIMDRIGIGNDFEFSPFGKNLYEMLNTNFDLTPQSLFNRYNKIKGE